MSLLSPGLCPLTLPQCPQVEFIVALLGYMCLLDSPDLSQYLLLLLPLQDPDSAWWQETDSWLPKPAERAGRYWKENQFQPKD